MFMTKEQEVIVDTFKKVYSMIGTVNESVRLLKGKVMGLHDKNIALDIKVDSLGEVNEHFHKRLDSIAVLVDMLYDRSGAVDSEEKVSDTLQTKVEAFKQGLLITQHSPNGSCTNCELRHGDYDCDVFAEKIDRDCTLESVVFVAKEDVYGKEYADV